MNLIRSRDIVGAVLAGGNSRRMGRDKALVRWQGRTLLGRAVEVLRSCFEDVVVIGPDRVGYDEAGVEVVPDLRYGLGPVGGIHTALSCAADRDVFILACDLPQVSAHLVRWIVGDDRNTTALDRPKTFARIVYDRQGPQPLCGLYSSGCLPTVEKALDCGNLSARALLSSLETICLELASAPAGIRAEYLVNLNSTQQLTELVAQMEYER